MTTAPDTRTMAQLIAVLAAAEVDCPGAGATPSGAGTIHGIGLCACNGHIGLDSVPRFRAADGRALFRVWCPNIIRDHRVAESAPWLVNSHLPGDWPCVCNGVGWLPLPEADLHLETLVDAVDPRLPYLAKRILEAYLQDGMLAALRALVAAVRARENDAARKR